MRLEPEVKTYKKRRELTPPSISPSKEPYPEIEADIAPFSRNEYRVQREYSLGMGTSLLPPQIHLVKSAKREYGCSLELFPWHTSVNPLFLFPSLEKIGKPINSRGEGGAEDEIRPFSWKVPQHGTAAGVLNADIPIASHSLGTSIATSVTRHQLSRVH